jgi:hypothetical protein
MLVSQRSGANMNRHRSANLHRTSRASLAVATLALLGSPLASRADAVDKAMDACVQAFVAASLPKEQRVVVDKLNSAIGPMDAQSRKYRIVLKATGSTSGREIAKGVCVTNRNGEVIALNGRRPPRLTEAVANVESAAR